MHAAATGAAAWGRCRRAALCLWLLLMQAPGVDAGTITVDGSTAGTPVVSKADFLEDPGGTLSLASVMAPPNQARFAPVAGRGLRQGSFGVTHSAVWLRFTVRSQQQAPATMVLSFLSPTTDHVDLYVPAADGRHVRQRAGALVPFHDRTTPHRAPLFELTLPPGSEQTMYLRADSTNTLLLSATLWQRGAFERHDHYITLAFSLYFGVIGGLASYNLLLFFLLRDALYLKYVAWCAAMALAQLARSGLGTEFLWPAHPAWNQVALASANAAMAAFACMFTRAFLDTRRHLPRADRTLATGQAWLVGTAVLGILAPGSEMPWWSLLTVGLAMVFVIVGTGLRSLQLRHPGAVYFMASWMGMMAAACVAIFLALGWVPGTVWTANAMLLGSAAEMLLLSFALADRVRTIRREKRRAQTGLLLALRGNESRLKDKVARRTEALHRANASLGKLNEALQQQNQALEQANTETLRLVASACHDLRQPAHALGMLADTLSASQPPAALEAGLKSARRCTATFCDMLSALMDLSSLGADSHEPQPAAVRLDDLLDEIEMQFALQAAAKGLSFDVARCGLGTVSDANLLRRMLVNLVSNAIKYTDTGGVTVAARRQAGHVLLTVKDTGRGIPPEKLSEVFTEYVRLAPSKPDEGLGIGLAVVRKASELLGHRLDLRSTVGRGTAVTLELPYQPYGETAPTQPADLDGIRRPAALAVAILENHRESREAMVVLVESWGYAVISSATPQALMAQLGAQRSLRLGLLIADHHLGEGLDGISSIAAIRARLGRPELPSLLVTGDLKPQVAERAAACPATLLHKPLDPRRLRSAIEAAMAQALTAH